MNRALFLLALAALPLAGCSGKAKGPDAKMAVAGPSKHNPWSVDGGATDQAPDPKAKDKPAAKKAPAKEVAAPSNPWAKAPPPGSVPAENPAAKPKGK